MDTALSPLARNNWIHNRWMFCLGRRHNTYVSKMKSSIKHSIISQVWELGKRMWQCFPLEHVVKNVLLHSRVRN